MTQHPINMFRGAGGGGGKGGSGETAAAPTVAANTLRSKTIARLIDLVSEGPIGGLVNGAQSVLFNQTALQNPDGSFNFLNTSLYERVGNSVQDPIPGFSDVENEFDVNQIVRSAVNHLGAIHVLDSSANWTHATVTISGGLGDRGAYDSVTGLYAVTTTNATAHAVISGGRITSIVLDNPGANYIALPQITITGDGTSCSTWCELAGGVVQTISASDAILSAVRIKVRVSSFYVQDTKGDVSPSSVDFLLQCKVSGGNWQTAYYDAAFAAYTTQYTPPTTGIRSKISVQVPALSPYEVYYYYRLKGAGSWTQGSVYRGNNATAVAATYYPQFEVLDLPMGQYEIMYTETYGNALGAVSASTSYHLTNATANISGKTTSGYEAEYRVDLPTGGQPWQIRVLRVTSDAIDDLTQNQITFASYTAIVDANMMYSDSAVYGIAADSQYFGGSVPVRSYDVYGRIVRVPSNYDPIARTYTGIWDGTFKLAWTNNPVWCFVDILTHDRYGLGQNITDDLLDFSALYTIAQYCDEMVDNGLGGTEPRFTFNTQIMNAEQAYNVLNLFVSVFRGMLYWSAGGITATQDSPRSPKRLVHRGNVLTDGFSYSGVPLDARHSVAQVSWNDPDNFYKTTVDVYEDQDLISRYGYVPAPVQAYGCTSRGQALRMGRWLLDTEKYATDIVTYRAGWDHADAVPGEVVALSDPAYAGVRQGGRIASATTTTIAMDAPYTFAADQQYTMSVVIPTWGRVALLNGSATVNGTRTKFLAAIKTVAANDVIIFDKYAKQFQVQSVTNDGQLILTAPYDGPNNPESHFTIYRAGALFYSSLLPIVDLDIINPAGEATVVTLDGVLPIAPNPNAPFLVTGSDVAPRLFRIIGNKEIDGHTYEITALEYDPTKYARVESNYQATTTKKLVDNTSALASVSSISVLETLYRANNQVRSRVTISWPPVADARIMYYQLTYQYKGGATQVLQSTSDTTFEFTDAPAGDYVFGVQACAQVAPNSNFVYKTFTALGKTAPPADVTGLTAIRNVNGVQLNWTAVADIDVVGYEIRQGTSWDSAALVTTQMNGTTQYVALTDVNQHTFFIKALDDTGNYSVNAVSITTSVSAPDDVTGFIALQDNDRVLFTWDSVAGDGISYDIREGDSFAIGRPVALLSGNIANAMYPLDGTRTFWIKAVSAVGLYSNNAAFSSITLSTVQNRNVIYTKDVSALGFPGSLFNVVPTGFGNSELALAPGKLVGEYQFNVNLGYAAAMRVRTWYDSKIVSDGATPTWAAATFTWASADAQLQWRPTLDVGRAKVEWFIAVNNTVYDPQIAEIWSYEINLTGDVASTAPSKGSYVAKQGVLAQGTEVTDNINPPTYTISVTSVFSVMVDIVIENPLCMGASNISDKVLELVRLDATGRFIRLLYMRDSTTPYFLLTDGNPSHDLVISYPGDSQLRLTFCIVQDSATRSLYMYDWDSTLYNQVSNSAPAVGGYSQLAA